MFQKTIAGLYFLIILYALTCPVFVAFAGEKEFLDMDLESLMKIRVTSAGRKAQDLGNVPAAIYVISPKAIRNSGATSVPELLRLVPGLQVAQISSNQWAVTSRGFNGLFANKLLVQLDGRTLYASSYSGVYWDMQSVMLEDIDRIEVIRGPGATLWGANAVNGVINIISKQSSDTQGTLVSGGGGNYEKELFNARYGFQPNDNIYGRIYLQHNSRDALDVENEQTDGNDSWQITKAGFRFDGDVGLENTWTLQGDLYKGINNQRAGVINPNSPPAYGSEETDKYDTEGFNMLGRWEHDFNRNNTITTQLYYDNAQRNEALFLLQKTKIFDFDLTHHVKTAERHDILWGIGYRYTDDNFGNTFGVQIIPSDTSSNLYSAFLQDEIEIIDNTIWVTLGTKVEHNDFTGFELQPNIRGLWRHSKDHSYWLSVSRAVRTPSIIENSGRIITQILPGFTPGSSPTILDIMGSNDFKSETLIAYEAGYRFSKGHNFSSDISFFYNDYEKLQSYLGDWSTSYFTNSLDGETLGVEIAINWIPLEWMETEFTYSYIDLKMKDTNTTSFSTDALVEGSSPQHQFSAKSLIKMSSNVDLNICLRYVANLDRSSGSPYNESYVDSYWNLDLNIIWKVTDHIELALIGKNIINSERVEYISEGSLTTLEVDKSIFAKATFNF